MPLKYYPEPSELELRVRNEVRAFADEKIRPHAIADDEQGFFRKDVFQQIAEKGWTTLSLPKAHGGTGHPYHIHYACFEELGRASTAMAVVVGVTNLIQGALVAFGSAAQQKQFLVPLRTGKALGAFSLSEPHAGSDAAALSLAARKVEGGYRLNGSKVWCSNAGYADLYLLMARTSPERTRGITSFIIPENTSGFRVGKQEKKLGLRASTLAELVFEDAFVPESFRLGPEGSGFKVALSQLDAGRISIGAAGMSIAMDALDRAWRWILERQRSSLPVMDGIKTALSDRFAETQALRSLLLEAGRARDAGVPFTSLASQVKLLGSDLAMRTTSEILVWMGEEGVRRELEVERLFRDAKALQIVEGTNQIQRNVLAREMEEMWS